VPGHGDASYAVESYDLQLDYRVGSNHLDARAELRLVPRDDVTEVALDLTGLGVTRVLVDGRRAARFGTRGGKLRIQLAEPAASGAPLTVTVRYGGQPRPLRSTWGELGWEELTDGVIVAGQPCGAPSWFPCNDRPDDKSTYRIAITTDAPYVAVANGVLVDRRTGASRVTWVYEQSQPMAAYLATVQIGRYEPRELAAAPVPQHLFAPPSLRSRAGADFDHQSRMMAVFEEAFGAYPFDGYAVVVTEDELEIPLEAQGLSIFGSNHVDGDHGLERLVAHELAHQWFGNSLTVARWSDIWLHEGFACYAEWLWSERSGGASADEHARRHHARLAGLPQDLVLVDPGPEAMFDDRLYKRGALAVHALRLALGDALFFPLLRDWVADHRHGTVTTGAFEEHANGYGPVSGLLRPWLREAALPSLPTRPTERSRSAR
jgi:aminopeptidase